MQWAPLARNVDPERHVEAGTSWPLVVVTALDAGRNWSLHDVIELRVEFGALITDPADLQCIDQLVFTGEPSEVLIVARLQCVHDTQSQPAKTTKMQTL